MKKNDILICIVILLGVLAFNLDILYADNTPNRKNEPKKILAPNEVCVYTAAGYLGYERCWKIKAWQRQILVDELPPEFSNTISSVRLGVNVNCAVYDHGSFAGKSYYTIRDIVDFDKFGGWGENWNDRAESLIIYRNYDSPNGVILREKPLGEGGYVQFFPLPEDYHVFSQKKTYLQARWRKNINSVDFYRVTAAREFPSVDLYDANGDVLTLQQKSEGGYLLYYLESMNWHNRVQAIRVYTHSPQKIKNPAPKQSPQHDKATNKGFMASLLAKKYSDLSGTWNSNIGLVYEISQNGNKISYQDPMMHKPVNGTVDGKTVTVSWMEGNAGKSIKGTITSVSNDGVVKRIEWENSVVFHR